MARVIPQAGVTYTDFATVTAVQRALVDKGFPPAGGVDGKYGPGTKDALRSWQYESGSDAVDGLITGPVLVQLGIPVPGAAQSGAQAQADAARAEAAARERARVDAEMMVERAKQKVNTAVTPQAQAVAQRELAAAEEKLASVKPEVPMWQYALAFIGVGAVGLGLYSMYGKKRR